MIKALQNLLNLSLIAQNKRRVSKKSLACFAIMLVTLTVVAQPRKHDSVAILLVDRMSDVISNMHACSFKLNTDQDVQEHAAGLTKRFINYEVYLRGPDKMLIDAYGYRGHRKLYFNGQQLAYYSFDENNYGIVPARNTIIRMIDSINTNYDIEFPAADFFYPAFTDDLIENADSIRYLGEVDIDGVRCYHILATGKERVFQFWINSNAYHLPVKFAITYKNLPGNPQYLASFSNWQINPDLPEPMFDFLPPPGASKIRLFSKSDR